MNQPESSSIVPDGHRTSIWPAIVTIGFACSVAMWLLGYLTHLRGLLAPSMVTGVLLLLVQLGAGFVAGRLVDRARAWKAGLGAGLLSSLINLLIVGSVMATAEGGNRLREHWHLILIGTLISGALIGFLGSMIGTWSSSAVRQEADAQRWLARFGAVAAISALPVLLSGGIVTSAEAGLAVPDWPTSFGSNMFLYPASRMSGGIYFEHAHRLFGTLVGLNVIALMIFTLIAEHRRWVKGLSVLALVIVSTQGILGGVRVTAADATAPASMEVAAAAQDIEVPTNYTTASDNRQSQALAMAHGIAGQLTFAYLLIVAAVLHPRWRPSHNDVSVQPDKLLHGLTLALLIAILIQLTLGAGARHFNHFPAFFHPHISVGALAVLVLALLAGFRTHKKYRGERVLRRAGAATAHSVGVQAALGIASWVAIALLEREGARHPAEIAITTAHQAMGALLLGFVVLLFVWIRRLVPAGPAGHQTQTPHHPD